MRILVAHPDFARSGGAEDYARRVVAALRDQGHAVDLVDRHSARLRLGPLRAPLRHLPGLSRLSLMTHALVCRDARLRSGGYDLTIFTYGEGPDTLCPRVELRHAPSLLSSAAADLAAVGSAGRSRAFVFAKKMNARLAAAIMGPRRRAADLTLANSAWTLRRAGTRQPSAIVYPPVEPPALPQRARVPGRLLSLGRLVRNKRHDEAIDIAVRLRTQGWPVSLDIIGHGGGAELRRLTRLAAPHGFIRILANADAATRSRALAEAEIGLHLYRHEHFGIAVAEMILSGVVPVVFDGGGVRELVTDPQLRFSDTDQAMHRVGDLLLRGQAERASRLATLQSGHAIIAARQFDDEIQRALDPLLNPHRDAA